MKQRPWSLIITTRALIAIALLFAAPIFMRAVSEFYLYDDVTNVPHAQAILVLGASVHGGLPSETLSRRADAAIVLFKTSHANKIIVSGDAASSDYDEVTPVKNYLLDAGVPTSSIFLDKFGLDTYSSIYRASYIFGARSLIIPSQEFHLPRAVGIARLFGLETYGFKAEGGHLYDALREIPACWKALWEIIVQRQPKFRGAPIPIAGDSNLAS